MGKCLLCKPNPAPDLCWGRFEFFQHMIRQMHCKNETARYKPGCSARQLYQKKETYKRVHYTPWEYVYTINDFLFVVNLK